MLPAKTIRKSRVWNIHTMDDTDWDAAVGKHDNIIDDTISVLADLPSSGFAPGVTIPLPNVDWEMPPDLGTLRTILDIRNSRVNWRINQTHHTQAYIHMRNSTMDVPLDHMSPGQTNGGALFGNSMSVYATKITSRIDGIWPGDGHGVIAGNASSVDLVDIRTPPYVSYMGYPLDPSNIPATVIGLAGTTGTIVPENLLSTIAYVQASHVYAPGEFIITNRNALYQVSTGGTSGSGVLADGKEWWRGWPGGDSGSPSQVFFKDLPSNATSQPFADGPNTLKLIFVGTGMHLDGIQIIRGGIVTISRVRIAGYANSCMIIQSAAQDYSGGSDPTGPVLIYQCDLKAGNYPGAVGNWMYIATNSRDPDNSGSSAGRWRRSGGGVWSAYATPWLGRPEMCSVIGNLFRNRSSDNLPPVFGSGQRPLFGHAGTTAGNGSGAATTGDWPVYVSSEEVRQAGITRQWLSPGVIDTSVLESRWQKGMFPNEVDARSWIVWADNVNEAGGIIYPIERVSIPGFDSHGYYTGI